MSGGSKKSQRGKKIEAPRKGINEALTPVSLSARVFSWHEHMSLWFSLGVGLLVMQIGAYLVPGVSTEDAIIAILVGSIVGSGLLAWTAKLGADTGLSSAGLMHATYGSMFAKVPVVLNIVQLIGWTTFELVVIREGTSAIAINAFGFSMDAGTAMVAATVFWGAILTALLAGSMVTLVRKFVSRFGLPLVVISLVWLTWQFVVQLQDKGFALFMNRQGDGTMTLFSAIDLVIAMPVSWLPLVADYARHGRSGKGALSGTWIGYAIANIWCYALGVIVVSVAEPGASMVTSLLLAQGGLIALGLILIDELDNAYGDVYSGSVSSHSLKPSWSIRKWGIAIAVVCTLLALILPIHTLEPFLLMLSSVFVPLFGVILGTLSGRESTAASKIGRLDAAAIKIAPATIWLLGIACYHLLAQIAPQWGSALPTLFITFVLARLVRGNRLVEAGA